MDPALRPGCQPGQYAAVVRGADHHLRQRLELPEFRGHGQRRQRLHRRWQRRSLLNGHAPYWLQRLDWRRAVQHRARQQPEWPLQRSPPVRQRPGRVVGQPVPLLRLLRQSDGICRRQPRQRRVHRRCRGWYWRPCVRHGRQEPDADQRLPIRPGCLARPGVRRERADLAVQHY